MSQSFKHSGQITPDKMNWHLKKILLKASNLNKGCLQDGYTRLPRKIIFEPTSSCNLNCLMCDRIHDIKPELTTSEIKRITNKLPSSIKEVYISGGEPFLRNDIREICNAFHRRNISVSIQTNGTFPEKAKGIAKLKNTEILLSLDGPSDIHDKMRGMPGVSEKTMEIMDFLKKNNKRCVITTVVSDENLSYLSGFPEQLFHNGLKPDLIIVEVIRRFSYGVISKAVKETGLSKKDIGVNTKKSIKPNYSLEEFETGVSMLKRTLDKYKFNYTFYPIDMISNMENIYNRNFRPNNRIYCTHFDVARIESNGELVPCFVFRKGFGNLLEDDFSNIWNCDEFKAFRKTMLDNNLTSACETCFRAVRVSAIERLFDKAISAIRR